MKLFLIIALMLPCVSLGAEEEGITFTAGHGRIIPIRNCDIQTNGTITVGDGKLVITGSHVTITPADPKAPMKLG